MFRHRLNATNRARTRLGWIVLCFLSGSINAGGFMAAERFVSHVTGFATLFGVEAANGNWDRALGFLTIPIYFLLGTMVSATMVDRRMRQGKVPLYAAVMSLVCACLLMAAFGGHYGVFDVFGAEPRLRQSYFLLALLCAASGLQNAAVSTASGATIRITHLTGLVTDIGTGLVRAYSSSTIHHRELKLVRQRTGIFLAFSLGSAAGAWLFLRVQYLGFLLPAGLAAICVFEAMLPHRRLKALRHGRRPGL